MWLFFWNDDVRVDWLLVTMIFWTPAGGINADCPACTLQPVVDDKTGGQENILWYFLENIIGVCGLVSKIL